MASQPINSRTIIIATGMQVSDCQPVWAWDSAKWESAKWESAKWDSAKWDSAIWDSAKWESAKWDSAKWDSAKWESAKSDSAKWDRRSGNRQSGIRRSGIRRSGNRRSGIRRSGREPLEAGKSWKHQNSSIGNFRANQKHPWITHHGRTTRTGRIWDNLSLDIKQSKKKNVVS